jgi:uncharacterized protein (TIGR02996 family)
LKNRPVLAIHYCRQDDRTRRHTAERTQIAIGRDAGNDLVLADPTVSDRHCRVTDHAGDWIVEDLGSERGTLVNGARIRAPVLVGEGDRIFVGVFVLEIEELDGRIGPVEEGLLEGIACGDDNSRTVYADWLEQRGDLVRAEFVRLQQAIIDAPIDTPAQKLGFLTSSKRLRELAASIDVEWRMRVARPAVEGCQVTFELPCKMDWGTLELTGEPDVRKCSTCRKTVHYCVNEPQALRLVGHGHCVVVDVRQGGLRCLRCGRENPRRSQVCFGCDAVLVPAPAPRASSPSVPLGSPAATYEPPLRPMVEGLVPMPLAAHALATRGCPTCSSANPPASQFCATCGARVAARG